MIMSVNGSVYVYLAIRVNTFGSINVFLWQRMDYVSEFLFCFRGKAIHFFFQWEITRGFYLGDSCVKLKSGRPWRPDDFSISLGDVETCREITAHNLHTESLA